ncbi:single-stranded DNA-binding protein [Acidipropionibacterium jensenii]|uniref:Single-stranded DNA-binding protein n=2 Tax=Acidipropionibacterium jensenii TaxID=1749 RepID=A0A3T0RYB5_9ACTN|nr:single-stranded DNA-binding protein [Acidipropionibacterium jensenii]AZZ39080.1 single-stranded DNA-binding protein [Acidipropionibacterium jensenii]MDN5977256.1 single-stranded DNA-binding protein [Acidipropionibacterium jensenii]MDN6426203.1 single-stranded DNA-binding protein [Acidipropionibacterium jensenii]MDN6442711.1 single-stranded DNA-binding protein [Acidipropionibacterium jensenii]MDN6480003.1 single-stranded DNA-binding protein [Acidipropionibacterium jensenii]
MDANVSITGNLGTEVDFIRKDGWCGGRFRIAQTPRYLREGQWSDGETTWMSVRVNGRLAENCRQSLSKGDPVVVVGRLRTQAWVTEDGVRREQLVILASSVGHDLQRGTSMFVRPTPRPEEAPIMEPGAVVDATTELLTDRSGGFADRDPDGSGAHSTGVDGSDPAGAEDDGTEGDQTDLDAIEMDGEIASADRHTGEIPVG